MNEPTDPAIQVVESKIREIDLLAKQTSESLQQVNHAAEQIGQLAIHLTTDSTHREALLPEPGELRALDALCPGFGEEFLKSVLEESRHRRHLAERDVRIEEGDLNIRRLYGYFGVVMFAGLSGLILWLAWVLIQKGNGTAAATMVTVLGALAILATGAVRRKE